MMQEQLRELISKHLGTLEREIGELSGMIRSWQADRASLGEALRLVHKIKGSAGSIGFGTVSSKAAALESVMKQAHKTSGESASALAGDLDAKTRELVDDVAGLSPQQSSLYNLNVAETG